MKKLFKTEKNNKNNYNLKLIDFNKLDRKEIEFFVNFYHFFSCNFFLIFFFKYFKYE